MAHITLYPQADLSVGGQNKTVFEASAVSGYRSPFATATARVGHDEGGFQGTEEVRLALGYRAQASRRTVFAGTVKEDSVRWAHQQVAFSAAGPLARTQEATGLADPAYTTAGDPTLPPETDPTTYARGWVDATDGQIVADTLALYGITDVNIHDTGRRFATLAPAVTSKYAVRLASDRPGWQLIEEIDRLTGCVTFDGPDGRVTRLAVSGLPSGSPARTFTQGLDFKGSDATRQKSNDGVYNRVVVRGQGLIDPTTGLAVPIEAERYAASPYVPTPPAYRLLTIESDLIETEEFAGEIAARVLGEVNRRTETVTLPLAYGDSGVYPGMTVAVVSPALGITADHLYRVVEVQHTHGGGGFQTTVVLVGGAAAEGTDPNQAPVALLDYETEIEGLADGSTIVLAALDGSGSRDPDGIITVYAWSGTPVAPTPIGDGRRASVAYHPWPATPPTVTLTVTDDHGKTASVTRTIKRDGARAYRREFWGAHGTETGYTPDGGVTWTDYPAPSVILAEQAGDGYQLVASDAGVLARILADGTVTNPAGPTGVTALHISRDRDGKETGVAWAAANDGRIWRSVDRGVSWVAVAPLPNGGRSNAIEESPYSPGDLYAGGGNALWHSYSAGAAWAAFYTHPDAGMVLRRIASGVAAGPTGDPAGDVPVMWLGFAGPAGAEWRVVERGGSLVHTLPAGEAAPLDIVGLTISLDAERLLILDSGAGGRAWVAPTRTGGDLTRKGAYNPLTLGLPTHVIRDGRFPVAWGGGASSLWKTTDEGANFLVVRVKPTYMVGYGRLIASPPPRGDVIWSAFDGTYSGGAETGIPQGTCIMALTDLGFQRRADPHPCAGLAGNYPLLAAGDGVLLTWARTGSGVRQSKYFASGAANSFYSTDGGATWQPTTLDWAVDFAVAPGGVVYAVCGPEHGSGTIWRSSDYGRSWTQRSVWLNRGGQTGAVPSEIIVNRADPQHVMVRQADGYWLSTDGGATWPPLLAGSPSTRVFPDLYARTQGGFGEGGHAFYAPDGTPRVFYWENLPSGNVLRVGNETTEPRGAPAPQAGDGTPESGSGEVITEGAVYFRGRAPDTTAYRIVGSATQAEAIFTAAANLPAGTPGTPTYQGFVPGDAANGWHWFGPAASGVPLAQGPQGADPPAGPYLALTGALAAAFPDGRYWCQVDGATRLIAAEG